MTNKKVHGVYQTICVFIFPFFILVFIQGIYINILFFFIWVLCLNQSLLSLLRYFFFQGFQSTNGVFTFLIWKMLTKNINIRPKRYYVSRKNAVLDIIFTTYAIYYDQGIFCMSLDLSFRRITTFLKIFVYRRPCVFFCFIFHLETFLQSINY